MKCVLVAVYKNDWYKWLAEAESLNQVQEGNMSNVSLQRVESSGSLASSNDPLSAVWHQWTAEADSLRGAAALRKTVSCGLIASPKRDLSVELPVARKSRSVVVTSMDQDAESQRTDVGLGPTLSLSSLPESRAQSFAASPLRSNQVSIPSESLRAHFCFSTCVQPPRTCRCESACVRAYILNRTHTAS